MAAESRYEEKQLNDLTMPEFLSQWKGNQQRSW